MDNNAQGNALLQCSQTNIC